MYKTTIFYHLHATVSQIPGQVNKCTKGTVSELWDPSKSDIYSETDPVK